MTIRNYFRKKRLFIDKKAMNKFVLHNMHNHVEAYTLDVAVLKHYINEKDEKEIKTRCKNLRLAGLKPPTTLKECDEMINDLRCWTL